MIIMIKCYSYVQHAIALPVEQSSYKLSSQSFRKATNRHLTEPIVHEAPQKIEHPLLLFYRLLSCFCECRKKVTPMSFHYPLDTGKRLNKKRY